jgi:hypothetical protein
MYICRYVHPVPLDPSTILLTDKKLLLTGAAILYFFHRFDFIPARRIIPHVWGVIVSEYRYPRLSDLFWPSQVHHQLEQGD